MRTATSIIVASLIIVSTAVSAMAGDGDMIFTPAQHRLVVASVKFYTPGQENETPQTTERPYAMPDPSLGPVFTMVAMIEVPEGAEHVVVRTVSRDLSGNVGYVFVPEEVENPEPQEFDSPVGFVLPEEPMLPVGIVMTQE